MPRVTSIRLPDDLADRLDQLARALDRPRTWVILQALTNYVAEQEDYIRDVEQGLAELDAGAMELVSHEHVMADLEELIQGAVGPESGTVTGDATHRVA